ncbi:MAG: DUF2793 domain-containing protein [Pseudomonadota bacterium]
MADTANLALPLLDAAQAQKHVTVNEALARVDALSFGAVASVGQTTPPVVQDGAVHIVGSGATDAWAGQDMALAIGANGGWSFYAPRAGWSVWALAESEIYVFDGSGWRAGAVAMSSGGAVTSERVLEFDQTLSGSATTTSGQIPDKAVVLGVTARVITEVAGATAWSLGVSGSPDRYGAGFGTALNTSAEGVTGQPQAYYGGTPLEITAAGGSFTAGQLRIAIHYQSIAAPGAV